jgi:hypothetical protein
VSPRFECVSRYPCWRIIAAALSPAEGEFHTRNSVLDSTSGLRVKFTEVMVRVLAIFNRIE